MQRSVGACTERAQMCQRSECPALCSQRSQMPSKSALCSFWGFLRNLHLCYSPNRQAFPWERNLAGRPWKAAEGGLFSRAVF